MLILLFSSLKTGRNLTSNYNLVKSGFQNNTFSLMTPSFFSPSPGRTLCLCLTFLSFFHHRNLRKNNPILLYVFMAPAESRKGAKNFDNLLTQYGDKTLTKACHIVENGEITLKNTVGKSHVSKRKHIHSKCFCCIIFSINPHRI